MLPCLPFLERWSTCLAMLGRSNIPVEVWMGPHALNTATFTYFHTTRLQNCSDAIKVPLGLPMSSFAHSMGRLD